MKFAWIDQQRQEFEVHVLCESLQVSRQGYYAWRERQRREPSASELRRRQLIAQIRQAYQASSGTYGSPRVHAELAEQQVACCVNTVAKLMRQAGLRADAPPRFVPLTTDSRHAHPVFENKLNRDFEAALPNRKWVCDIAYVATGEGFLYVAGAGLRPCTAVMDLCSRKIVGWSMAEHLRSELCLEALNMAIQSRKPGPGLLHHSDRGVQYACREYQTQL